MIGFELIDKAIIITNHVTGKVIWQGKPFGCSIEKAIPLLDGSGCILLLGPKEFAESEIRYQGNMVLINSKGEMMWIADIPETKDVYVNIKWEGNTLVAYSWGGYQAEIDIGNGKIMSLKFTK